MRCRETFVFFIKNISDILKYFCIFVFRKKTVIYDYFP